ncbi:MAG: insulinase family protein [Gammaproteobacteria bacterium]|nr:insulinase family protein [Gammaproteobacteria bacterium]MBP9728937.1 insulinase family protein [Gammaproteobacteria bacterium]
MSKHPTKVKRPAYRNPTRVATFKCLVVGLLFCLSHVSQVYASDTTNTFSYKLDNGLKLIVREDTRAPTVVTQVWYGVGGSDEPNGLTGISHALEHMMFKGTPQYPDKTLARLVAVHGGILNAFTANDFTAYYEEVGTQSLDLCLGLEADRMVNLSLYPKDFEPELKVVMEERRMRYDDNPEMLALERLYAAAYISNPYHHLTIGWVGDIQGLTVDDLRNWYKTWYGPNNAVVVIVGDVKADDVFAMVKKHFGALQPISLPTRKARIEIAPLGKRQVQVNAKASVPRTFMAYNVPSLTTATDPQEPYALMVLSMALSQGQSARLSQNLERKQGLATNMEASYDPFSKYESLFTFSAVPMASHTLAEVEAGFLNEVTDLQKNLLSEEALNRIKTNAVAQQVFKQDSMSDQAIEIGALETVGLSWQIAEAFPQRIQAVSAEAVRAVAQKYLRDDRLTVAELIPLPSGK